MNKIIKAFFLTILSVAMEQLCLALEIDPKFQFSSHILDSFVTYERNREKARCKHELWFVLVYNKSNVSTRESSPADVRYDIF